MRCFNLPNLVQSVKEMLKRGMPEQEIKQNLQELGVDDADSIYLQAVKEQAAAPAQEGVEATPSVSRLAAALPAMDLEPLEKKLDDLQAEVKALSEIMQKILDSERQILLRLKGE